MYTFCRKLPFLFLALFLVLSAADAAAARHKKKPKKHVSRQALNLRMRRMARTFVASADLRPMAQQLLQSRTPAAYAGVEKYARAHGNSDAGALAWLAIGYAHVLDSEYDKAISPLKRAKAHAGELQEYVSYFLAMAQGGTGAAKDVVATLKDFDDLYPESFFARDAAVIGANALLVLGKSAEAVALLEEQRQPLRADVELAFGRAQLAAGDKASAVECLRRIYYLMPSAPEAEAAQAELQTLAKEQMLPPVPFEQRKQRAELLLQNRRASDAVVEYKSLLQEAQAGEAPALSVALGNALSRSGKSKEARDLLEKLPETNDELNSRRLYYLLELYRPDEKKVTEIVQQLRAKAAHSPWFQEALLSAANTYLLQQEYAAAGALFAELSETFPSGKYAPFANSRAAWMRLRAGDPAAAKQTFERQISVFPNSAEASSALYWLGWLAEQQGDTGRARAYYMKVSERYRNGYYGEQARRRLPTVAAAAVSLDDSLLNGLAPLPPPPQIDDSVPPDNLRIQKSKLLENCGMIDFAVRELENAGLAKGISWNVTEAVKLYTESARSYQALRALKRAVPGYYSFEVSDLPRPFWEGLFPRPYWEDVKRYSAENQLDPFLVASLIRQESEFNPGAISRAEAIGLMQLLPVTGKKLAKDLKVRNFTPAMLLDPTTNVKLGTRYFRALLDRYDGKVEYALAAYNAGPERVEDWRKASYRDMPEFVESIPFTETREYVQAILRNVGMYQRLYQTP